MMPMEHFVNTHLLNQQPSKHVKDGLLVQKDAWKRKRITVHTFWPGSESESESLEIRGLHSSAFNACIVVPATLTEV